MQNFEFTILIPHKRLDRFLVEQLEGYTRTRIKQLVKQGCVYVDEQQCLEPDKHLKPGMAVRIDIPSPQKMNIIPEDIALDIIFEDDNMIIINKPSGIVVHPAAGNWRGTIVHGLVKHCGDSLSGINGVTKPGIVHRLDKNTSGVMVVAKNDKTHQWLVKQFSDKESEIGCVKLYCCVVWHRPFATYGTVNAPIARCKINPMKQVIASRGKEAITHYTCIDTCYNEHKQPLASLMLVRIVTGRTHQIRVHMNHLGCSIIGDNIYGAHHASKINQFDKSLVNAFKKPKGQLLHALALGIIPVDDTHKMDAKKRIFYYAKIPKDMCHNIALLFGYDSVEKLIHYVKTYEMTKDIQEVITHT